MLGYDRRQWDEERSELAAARMMAAESDMERDTAEQRSRAQAAAKSSAAERSGASPASQRQRTDTASQRDAPVPFKVAVVDTELDEQTNKVFYIMEVERLDESR